MVHRSCEIHDDLLAQANAILRRLYEVTQGQMSVIEDGVGERFMRLDRELELALGEKERLIGALRQHDEEHGCQATPALWNPSEPETN